MSNFAIYFPLVDEYLRDIHALSTGANDGLTSWNSHAEDITTFPTAEEAEDFIVQHQIMMGEVVPVPVMVHQDGGDQ